MAEGRTCKPSVWAWVRPLTRLLGVCFSLLEILQIGWLKTNRNSLLTIPEVGKTKVKFPAWWPCSESPLPGSQTLPCCVLTRRLGISMAFLRRMLVPFTKVPPLGPNHLPKPSLPTTITFGARILPVNLRERGAGNTYPDHKCAFFLRPVFTGCAPSLVFLSCPAT